MLCRASVVGAVHRCGGAAARQFALTGRLIQAQIKFALTSHALLACGCATGCERRSPCTPCSLCKIKSEAYSGARFHQAPAMAATCGGLDVASLH